MIEKTLEIFKDYIITDYTPVGSIMHLLKKFNFGFMQNNRNLIFLGIYVSKTEKATNSIK